jgi:hypothetical protein
MAINLCRNPHRWCLARSRHTSRAIEEYGVMKFALFCLETSRDDYGRLRIRFALCIYMRAVSETYPTAV